jgi:predicted secreted protein
VYSPEVEHLQYDESTNGQQIELAKNDEFEISLPETRTAGYHWRVKNNGGPVCNLLDETAQADPSHKGGSGTHHWRFQAASPGRSEIELHYLRSWEQTVEPARTFKLQVRVRP